MATFGDTTTGTGGWNLAANTSIFSDFVLSETADIESMSFYINTNSGSGTYTLELGIYSSSSGQPVTKQVSAERADVPHGSSSYQWITVNMTLNGLAAATYCLGGVSPDGFAYYGEASSGGVTSTKTSTYPLPSSYGTRTGNDDGWRYNVYATYTAASGTTDGDVSISGAGTLTATGASSLAVPINIASTATLTATGASRIASPVTISATASLTATGASQAASPVTIASTATASFVGASTTLTSGDFSILSSAVLSAVGASSNSADISASSTATAQLVGASGIAADFAAASVATLTMVGAAVHSALWNGAATATVDMVGETVAAGEGAFDITSTASVEMVGAAAAAAAAEMAGTGLVSFVSTATTEETPEVPSTGADSGGTGASRHYIKKKERNRIQKNNDLFMALCQAALPHLVAAYRNSTTITY
jgi:hypothetical protein